MNTEVGYAIPPTIFGDPTKFAVHLESAPGTLALSPTTVVYTHFVVAGVVLGEPDGVTIAGTVLHVLMRFIKKASGRFNTDVWDLEDPDIPDMITSLLYDSDSPFPMQLIHRGYMWTYPDLKLPSGATVSGGSFASPFVLLPDGIESFDRERTAAVVSHADAALQKLVYFDRARNSYRSVVLESGYIETVFHAVCQTILDGYGTDRDTVAFLWKLTTNKMKDKNAPHDPDNSER